MKKYDLVVLGGGPAGYAAAIKAKKEGLKTAIVEEYNMGGTSFRLGSVPMGILFESGIFFNSLKEADRYGVSINGDISLMWNEICEKKQNIINQMAINVENLLKINKVDVYRGFGRVKDLNHIEVLDIVLEFQYLVIATGSKPRIPEIPDLKAYYQREKVMFTKNLYDLKNLPKSIYIYGAGNIAVEMASLLQSLGVSVTLFFRGDIILKELDEDIRLHVYMRLKKQGVRIFNKHQLIGLDDEKLHINANGEMKFFAYEKLFLATGRLANQEGLEFLELKGNHKGFIDVDKNLKTRYDHIYCAGDANGQMLLANFSALEGSLVVDNILGKNKELNYEREPICIYGNPEIGVLGLTEKMAREKYNVRIEKFPIQINGKVGIKNDDKGFLKFIIKEDDNLILGVHIIGNHAIDRILEMKSLMKLDGKLEDFENALHAHPIVSEVLIESAHMILNLEK
jgi:dihydrolipoamide dehydrogenase